MANQQPLPPTAAGSGPVYLAARQAHAVAVNSQIRGTMELRQEAWEFPLTLAEIAALVRARATLCTKEAVEPQYAAALAQIATTVDAAAQAARALGPAFDALHDKEIRRVLQPRTNEQKWDTTANGRG